MANYYYSTHIITVISYPKKYKNNTIKLLFVHEEAILLSKRLIAADFGTATIHDNINIQK
jgi:hypothetical protein